MCVVIKLREAVLPSFPLYTSAASSQNTRELIRIQTSENFKFNVLTRDYPTSYSHLASAKHRTNYQLSALRPYSRRNCEDISPVNQEPSKLSFKLIFQYIYWSVAEYGVEEQAYFYLRGVM